LKLGFYPGCAYGSAAGYRESVEAVCRNIGIELVEIPDWNCCGATTAFSLNEPDALLSAGRVMALAFVHGHDEIITVCNACYTTLRKAEKIFHQRPDTLDIVDQKLRPQGLRLTNPLPIRHFLEILQRRLPQGAWTKAISEPLRNLKVAAYYGCQLTRPWADIDHPERPTILEEFIERIGFRVVSHSAGTLCCGSSHAVAYGKECAPLISRITGEIRAKGADVITTICPLCQFNLDAGQLKQKGSLPVLYFTQLAGLSLGLSPKVLGMEKLLIPFKYGET
jgi:heterodisulfide reductase subunit B2